MDKNDYIFGIRAVIEAIEAGKEIDKILVKKDLQGELAHELFAAARSIGTPIQRVPVERINRITRKNHQGVVAFLSAVEYNTLDTSAKLIDNSVYLPLRRLMENAGYEVSWDAEARKAYVTVDGNKIEMTGTIVDNKTYVKVRDFEKLGAKVDYEETIYYADAWNDFSKSCYATITFK